MSFVGFHVEVILTVVVVLVVVVVVVVVDVVVVVVVGSPLNRSPKPRSSPSLRFIEPLWNPSSLGGVRRAWPASSCR